MWVCGSCSRLWAAWLHQCGRPGCGGQLRRVDERDADHPVLARFPIRKLLARTVSPSAGPEPVAVVPLPAVAPASGGGRRRRVV